MAYVLMSCFRYRRLIDEGLIIQGRKLYQRTQVFVAFLNASNRNFRLPFLFRTFDALLTICGFTLIAQHQNLAPISTFSLAILLLCCLYAMLFFRVYEHLRPFSKDFCRELSAKAHQGLAGNVAEVIRFINSLFPLVIYKGETPMEHGLVLGIIHNNINYSIFLLFS